MDLSVVFDGFCTHLTNAATGSMEYNPVTEQWEGIMTDGPYIFDVEMYCNESFPRLEANLHERDGGSDLAMLVAVSNFNPFSANFSVYFPDGLPNAGGCDSNVYTIGVEGENCPP